MKNPFNKIKESLFGSNVNDKLSSETAKQEMLESLKLIDDIDLYSIDLSKYVESDVSMKWDTVKFKDWIVQKDEIWNYIMINGVKCREYQPWISWFTYQNIKNRYHFWDWLEIGFCDKWDFKKSITIEDSWLPKECILFPKEISDLLWWHLYELKVNPQNFYDNKAKNDKLSSKDEIFANIDRNELYTVKSNLNNKHDNPYAYKKDIFWEDEDGKFLSIKGKRFNKFKPGMSGLAYVEFLSDGLWEPCVFLAEFKDGEMVGEWIIMSQDSKHIIRN